MADIREFLSAAPEGAGRVLQLLAVAESLTDDAAQKIYELDPIEGLPADIFINALHYADFLVPRNSEWHIEPDVRHELQLLGLANQETVTAAHRTLLSLGTEGDRALAGSRIPSYLFTNAGRLTITPRSGTRT
jgi:hypothetical protein